MKTPDVNVLLYAVNADAAQQPVAARWLERAYADADGIGYAWIVLSVSCASRHGPASSRAR